MAAKKLRAALDDHMEASDASALDTGTEGGAKQSFKDECDINVILKRFGVGYEMPENHRPPQYGDFTGINDYHAAATALRQAQETFDELPAHIRSKFDNDPAKYVDFAIDRKNEVEMADLGLLSKEATRRVKEAQEQRAIEEDAKAATRHEQRTKSAQHESQAQTPSKKG